MKKRYIIASAKYKLALDDVLLILPQPRLIVVVVKCIVDLFGRHIALWSALEYVCNGFLLKTVHIARTTATWQAFDQPLNHSSTTILCISSRNRDRYVESKNQVAWDLWLTIP